MIQRTEGLFREGKNRNERKAVKKLQREYWLLKNVEYVVSRIDEIERQKKLQQQQQEESLELSPGFFLLETFAYKLSE